MTAEQRRINKDFVAAVRMVRGTTSREKFAQSLRELGYPVTRNMVEHVEMHDQIVSAYMIEAAAKFAKLSTDSLMARVRQERDPYEVRLAAVEEALTRLLGDRIPEPPHEA